jgi:hypothetical protein
MERALGPSRVATRPTTIAVVTHLAMVIVMLRIQQHITSGKDDVPAKMENPNTA